MRFLTVLTCALSMVLALEVTITDGQQAPLSIAYTVLQTKSRESRQAQEKIIEVLKKDVCILNRLDLVSIPFYMSKEAFLKKAEIDYFMQLKVQNADESNKLSIEVAVSTPWLQERDDFIKKSYVVNDSQESLIVVAHQIADELTERILGMPGYASYPMVYVQEDKKEFLLVLSDLNGELRRVLYRTKNHLMNVVWSHDARKIACIELAPDRVKLILLDRDTRKMHTVVSDSMVVSPLFGLDQRTLYYVHTKTGSSQIYKRDLVTNHEEILTSGHDVFTELHYGSEPHHLLVTSERSGRPQIYQFDLHNKKMKRLTFSDKFCGRALWVPGENALLYSSFDESGRLVLFKRSLAERLTIQITEKGYDESPVLSPCAALLAFERTHLGKKQIIFKSLESGQEKIFALAHTSSPSWASQPGFELP